ncbi:hypothetical protein FRC16_004906 [Serendipita sp. 398]|nr:hypothetical protein FRC16_004906 [Serendipita sp. 398]
MGSEASRGTLLSSEISGISRGKHLCISPNRYTKGVGRSLVTKRERLRTRFSSLNPDRSARPTLKSSAVDDAHLHAMRLLSRTHELRHYIDAELSVEPGSFTDLSVSISHQSFRWTWELDFVGSKLSASILSQQLILPLVITGSFAFNHHSSVPLVEQSALDLQKELDRVTKVVRNPHLGVVQALKRPRFTTALARTSAMINGVDIERIPQVVTGFDEASTTLEESIPPPPPHRSSPLPVPRTRDHVPTPALPIPESPIQPAMDLDKTLDSEPDEELGNLRKGEKRAAPARKAVDSATETDSDHEASSTGREPPTKTRRVIRGVSPLSSEDASNKDGPTRRPLKESWSPPLSDPEDFQDVPPPPPPGGGRGRGTASSRLKQPIKRGGRRL